MEDEKQSDFTMLCPVCARPVPLQIAKIDES
jgi:hypothetical protein